MGDTMPVRCFTCGKVICVLYDKYLGLMSDLTKDPEKILDGLGLKRDCCRRMITSHVEIPILDYSANAPKSTVIRELERPKCIAEEQQPFAKKNKLK